MLRRTFVDCSIGNFAERLRLQVSRRFAGFRNEFEIGSPGPTTDCDRRARPPRADFRFAQPDNAYKLIIRQRRRNAENLGSER
jgi:hypothetical protein